MFKSLRSTCPASKAYIWHGSLPPHIDPEQPPFKKKPFGTILGQPFTHTVEVTLPEELYDLVWEDVAAKVGGVRYSRVIMSLSQVLEGGFFNGYIKAGNILMLSEGRPGTDNQYFLKDGHLHLHVPKDLYERTGLVGKPIQDGGRKHVKTRYAIELDLRQPSMVHGKKGFERIVWAFKNVLTASVTWLFHDFNDDPSTPSPLTPHHPTTHALTPQTHTHPTTLIPPLTPPSPTPSTQIPDLEAWATETYEYLSLLSLHSPRLSPSDPIDPFLSRYQVPTADNNNNDNDTTGPEDKSKITTNIITVKYRGLIPAPWIRKLFIALSTTLTKPTPLVSSAPNTFFALQAYAFMTGVGGKEGYCILCPPRLADDGVGGGGAGGVGEGGEGVMEVEEEEGGGGEGGEEETGGVRKGDGGGAEFVVWEFGV